MIVVVDCRAVTASSQERGGGFVSLTTVQSFHTERNKRQPMIVIK